MTNTELLAKIKAEIERLQKYNHCMADNAINSNMRNFYDGEEDCCKQLLSFLSTLESEKPMNQDELEKEIDRLWESFADEMEGPHNLFDIYARLARHFAQWQKEQMMKEAVEGVVMDFSSNQPRPQVDVYVDPNKYHTGDKVRVFILKKEE